MIHITRRERFCAAHVLRNENWSDEKNLEVFGKCANTNWHGHNFELFVTIKGELDPDTGFVLNLKDLSNIFNLTNCDIFNLQYGDVENEINNFNSENKNKLINIEGLDLFNDFDGIASLLKSLDFFITISNSTAHLAGALGVKTILIKPENFTVFHYWNQKTDNTPWYNSVKLIDKKDFLRNSEFLNNFLGI